MNKNSEYFRSEGGCARIGLEMEKLVIKFKNLSQ